MIAVVAGARPNFMKIAPIIRELRKRGVEFRFIHTGQHNDYAMSTVFLSHLELPEPDYSLEVGPGTHGYQTGVAIIKLEELFIKLKPDMVLVVGDVNSTLAGALAASKLGIKIAHVEAGLRSFDRSMPEEINRILTDAVSDILFTSCMDANANLEHEGIPKERVFLTGNVMIDSLLFSLPRVRDSRILEELGLDPATYMYVTLHRPSNVDEELTLSRIVDSLKRVSESGLPMVFPMHPRTKKMLEGFHMLEDTSCIQGLFLLDPVGYLESIALIMNARLVLTDSGGVQEETTFLGIPCLTLRPNTERPITITEGANILLGAGPESIVSEVEKIMSGTIKSGTIPFLWDGMTSQRIVEVLISSGI